MYVVRCLSYWIWSDVFTKITGFGKEGHRGKVTFSSHHTKLYTVNIFTTVDADQGINWLK